MSNLQKVLEPTRDACSICLEEIDLADESFTTKCEHVFHRKCIDVWLKQQVSCPLCRNKDIYTVLISFIRITENKQYYINRENSLFRKNDLQSIRVLTHATYPVYLYDQPPQAWLDSSQYDSLLPLYTLKGDIDEPNPVFISYYLRQLLLWEDIDESKIVKKYDDSSKLYLCSTQDFSSSFLTKNIVSTLVGWLYELLVDIRQTYKLEYGLTLNTLILDLTISTIVSNRYDYVTSKFQLILITSVYNCIKFYTKNNIIKGLNLTDEEFKEKLLWYTDNSYVWDQHLSNEISDTLNANVSKM